jgi:hypothetical protein
VLVAGWKVPGPGGWGRGCRMILPKPDKYDLAVRIDVREWRGPDLSERLDGVTVDFRDASYWVPSREHASKAGSNQHVSRLDVSVSGQIGKRERGGVTGSNRYGAQPSAFDLNGNGVLRIRNQNDFGAPGTYVRGLPDHPFVIEHRLGFEDAIDGAPVDEDALPQAVELDVHDLRRQPTVGNRRKRVPEAP